MNKLLVLSGLLLVCSLFNLLNMFLTGNGFSLVMGILWLAVSAGVFVKYRQMNRQDKEEENA